MPELPDVQIFKRYLDVTSLKKKIAKVVECDGDLLEGLSKRKLASELKGKSFMRTSRYGKYLFAGFGEDAWLVLHFGMSGFLRAFGDLEKAPAHTRLLLRFEEGGYLAYDCQRKLGAIGLTDSVEGFVAKKELGPDALALCADPDVFTDRLTGRRGSIKSLLMNQKALAGIGNIYADEILFLAGWRPEKKAGDLQADELRTLAGKCRHILETAIERRAGEKGWPRTWLLPRREEGRACPRCPGKIVRTRVSGRGTYYCPEHQR